MQSWKRAETFCYFSKIAPTGYSVTSQLDITALRGTLKSAGLKFYPAYLWLVTKALGEQPEFMTAENDGTVGHYNFLTPLYAVFHDDDKTFSLMWTEYDDCFTDFYAAYISNAEAHGENHGILARKDTLPPPNAYTVSCMPWISFEHFSVHSYDNKPYYFPSVEAGKFFEQDGKILLPLSVTCHHAASDGWHLKCFFESLQRYADDFKQFI